MPPSTFAWMDTSEHERRQVLDVVDLFQARDTRDELGMGSVRDAWADRLVPAVSTIQTRARYFFFIPWVYQELERRRVGAEAVARRARRAETDLIHAILRGDPGNVPIGARVGVRLKRLPSSVYWNGLRQLRILLFPGSQEQYHRSFGRQGAARRAGWAGLDGEGEGDAFADRGPNWNPHLPPPPEDFLESAVMTLQPEEAAFLRDQWQRHGAGSLMAELLSRDELHGESDFPWQHPAVPTMRAELRGWIEHARNLSVVIHGAALLYNLMLAERAWEQLRQHEGATDVYRARLSTWGAEVKDHATALAAWDRDAFWALGYEINPRLPARTKHFAEAWFALVLEGAGPGTVPDDERARELVGTREVELKRARSRLRSIDQLARWSGAAGIVPMDFRWRVTQTLVADVQRGLGNA